MYDYRITPAELIDFYMYDTFVHPKRKRRKVIHRILCALAVIAILALYITISYLVAQQHNIWNIVLSSVIAVLVLVGIIIFYPFLQKTYVLKRIINDIGSALKSSFYGDTKLEILQDSMKLENPFIMADIKYSGVVYIGGDEKNYYIYIASSSAIIVPFVVFADDIAKYAFEENVKEKAGIKK